MIRPGDVYVCKTQTLIVVALLGDRVHVRIERGLNPGKEGTISPHALRQQYHKSAFYYDGDILKIGKRT